MQSMFDTVETENQLSFAEKLHFRVLNMFETWERGSEKRLTQLFFCDLSTPKNDGSFNVYDDIRQKLIARGVPADEIRFIHEADTEAKKLELFKKVRRGDVRILMGSTQKMGAGTNVQNKLAASSDLDCPWRPSDLEQRLGRSIRQGNENAEVHIYRFVTEETFDAYLYQLVEGKQKFASQIMTSKSRCDPARILTKPHCPMPRSRCWRPAIPTSKRRWTWTFRFRSCGS